MFSGCPFCHHEKAELYRGAQVLRDSADVRDFCKCSECGTIYPESRIDINESLKCRNSIWEMSKPPENYKYRFSRIDFMTRLIANCRKKYNLKNALDIGSGMGDFCCLLKAMNIEAHGLESQEKTVEYAVKLGRKVRYGVFPDDIPPEFNGMKFDLISCNESIFYFPDLKKALDKIYELLSENGILLIKMHQPCSHYYSQDKSLFSRYGNIVQNIPTAGSLRHCLTKVGFGIEKVEPLPEEYFRTFFKLDRKGLHLIKKIFTKFFFIQRAFNEAYHVFFADKDKLVESADRLIVIARKIIDNNKQQVKAI